MKLFETDITLRVMKSLRSTTSTHQNFSNALIEIGLTLSLLPSKLTKSSHLQTKTPRTCLKCRCFMRLLMLAPILKPRLELNLKVLMISGVFCGVVIFWLSSASDCEACSTSLAMVVPVTLSLISVATPCSVARGCCNFELPCRWRYVIHSQSTSSCWRVSFEATTLWSYFLVTALHRFKGTLGLLSQFSIVDCTSLVVSSEYD